MALPRSRFASITAAASAYDTIISGITEAKTGTSCGSGRSRAGSGQFHGQGVERDPQPVDPDGRVLHHRPGTEKSPVQTRAAQSFEVELVGPVGGLQLAEIDAATPRRVDLEQCRAGEEPANRLLGYRKALDTGYQAGDEGHERIALGDVSGAVDQRILASDELERHSRS